MPVRSLVLSLRPLRSLPPLLSSAGRPPRARPARVLVAGRAVQGGRSFGELPSYKRVWARLRASAGWVDGVRAVTDGREDGHGRGRDGPAARARAWLASGRPGTARYSSGSDERLETLGMGVRALVRGALGRGGQPVERTAFSACRPPSLTISPLAPRPLTPRLHSLTPPPPPCPCTAAGPPRRSPKTRPSSSRPPARSAPP